MQSAKRILLTLLAAYLLLCCLTACVQRRLLYYPSHEDSKPLASRCHLVPWSLNGEYIGLARVIPGAKRTWLFLHGNGGQAVDRGYALSCFSENDSVYLLEYPGYGQRAGSPSRKSIDQAAITAFQSLQQAHPDTELCVFGESLGSGPACHLATLPKPPARIVLAVPFDRITDVAQEKFPFLPIRLLMLDRWNNIVSLQHFHGPVDIFGATQDQVIPIAHARALAQSIPGARFHEMDCSHNGWSSPRFLNLRD